MAWYAPCFYGAGVNRPWHRVTLKRCNEGIGIRVRIKLII